MTAPARTLSILAIPAFLVIGVVVFVGACGVPLPTEPVNDAPEPSTDAAVDAPSVSSPSAEPPALEPHFTPMTVRPVLTNATVVRGVLMAEYPPLLRDAGIGGAPVVWIHIATTGEVDDARIFESSGFEALDRAALNVARAMTFDPAMNGDVVTDAWVQVPIRFAVVDN
jgi:protein TonB